MAAESARGWQHESGQTSFLRRLLSPQHLIIGATLLAVGYLVLSPTLILLVGAFRTSILDRRAATWTLQHFVTAFADPELPELLSNSLQFAIGTALLTVIMGTLLAWISERTNTPGPGLVFAFSLVPLILPSILNTVAWIFLLSPRIGLVNKVFQALFGLQQAPFSIYSMGGMIWVAALDYTPLAYLLMVAAFRAMDPSLEEAAHTCGARLWQTFYYITLRLSWPALFSVLLIIFVRGLESFETPALVGLPAGIFVFTSKIFESLRFWPPKYGVAGAFSLSLVALTSLGIYFYSRLTRQAHRYAVVTGKGYRPAPMDLGPWKYLTLALVISYFLVILVLPLSVLVWNSFQPFPAVPSLEALQHVTAKNYVYVLNNSQTVRAMLNSLYLGAGSATAAMLLAAVVSWVTIKSRMPGRWLVDNLAFTPLVFPGLVMGVALMFLYATLPFPIYGTIWILFIAYITRYLPYAVRYTSTSMVQLHRELEESAAASGASWWQTFRVITLPLLRPGLVAGWIYIFVVSFRELSSSLLLYSTGSEVMSVVIWQLLEHGSYTQLSALGVVLIAGLLMVVGLALMAGQRFGIRQ